MMNNSFATAICAGFTLLVSGVQADTLTLRNGQIVTGTYMGGNAREVRMDAGRDRLSVFPLDQVSGIQFDSNGSGQNQDQSSNVPPPNYDNNAPRRDNDRDRDRNQAPPQVADNNNGTYNNGTYNNAPQNAPNSGYNDNNQNVNNAPQGITLPAGTNVVVRMADPVDSDSSRVGRTYRASVDEPVVVDGQTVIPRGADVMTKIVEDTQSGKFEGRTMIALALQSISVNGQMFDVTSQDVTRQSGNRTARSAGVIGGGTVLGAILGGIAGGGRGAAIGAVSGAAVGSGAQAITHGERVRIPSETRLTFTLTSPVSF